MRVVRPIAGLLLGALGIMALLTAGVGWQVAAHRDATGAFSADLSPIHTDGYAIVVPDVAGAIRRHGLARLVDAGEVRIGVSSAAPVVLVLAPASDVNHFLDGIARTAVTGVGYAVGAQPVSASQLSGVGAPPLVPQRPTWAVAPDRLSWRMQTDSPTSLLVLRTDGRSGFSATLTVALRPPAWGLTVGGLAFVTGLLLVCAGVFLVRPRRRRERFVMVEPDYGADDAGWVVGAYSNEEPPRPVQSPYVYTAT